MELLKDILGRFLQTSGLARRAGVGDLRAAWEEAVGPGAEHTRIDAIRQDVLTVVVDSAALLAELANFRKDELLGALRQRAAGQAIGDIRFRLGSVKPRRRPADSSDAERS